MTDTRGGVAYAAHVRLLIIRRVPLLWLSVIVEHHITGTTRDIILATQVLSHPILTLWLTPSK
jgi:hypothetical protein